MMIQRSVALTNPSRRFAAKMRMVFMTMTLPLYL